MRSRQALGLVGPRPAPLLAQCVAMDVSDQVLGHQPNQWIGSAAVMSSMAAIVLGVGPACVKAAAVAGGIAGSS